MDSITFELGDVVVQLTNGLVHFWIGCPDHDPDVTVPIDRLSEALSTARMLRKSDHG